MSRFHIWVIRFVFMFALWPSRFKSQEQKKTLNILLAFAKKKIIYYIASFILYAGVTNHKA